MITATTNPRVKQVVQWQSKSKERYRDKVFVVEGTKMYLEAPDNLVREVYVSAEMSKQLTHRDEKRQGMGPQDGKHQDGKPQDMDVLDASGRQQIMARLADKLSRTGYETVSDEVFAKMSDTRTPQGILAILQQPEYDLDKLLQQPNPLFLVLENLQDPGNLGTILRTGEGADVTGVIISEDSVDIFNPKVIRATMGSVYRVPFLYEKNLLQTLEKLHTAGVKTYAAHLQGMTYYDSFSFQGPVAFLIGNEGNGLSRELADAASSYLKIPMEGQLESLNASVAAALLMYEVHRQRKKLRYHLNQQHNDNL